MATGPEHYEAAEELLKQADLADARRRNQNRGGADAYILRESAAVHATLALAAATALQKCGSDGVLPRDDHAAWMRVASEAPAAAARRREEERELAKGADDA